MTKQPLQSRRADWIYSDADNTLWDTDELFAAAQLALLSAAEGIAGVSAPLGDRLKYLREYDQAIARRHHSGLRYPPALLTRALVAGLLGSEVDDAASRVVASGSLPSGAEADAVFAFNKQIAAVPRLLQGVWDGLHLAESLGIPVYVVTEGPAEIARERIQRLEIESLIAGVLSAPKTLSLYQRLVERAKPLDCAMIGDQPDRDIRLAHDAGMRAIFVPSRFKPIWQTSLDIEVADAVVTNFLYAVSWVAETKVIEG